VNSQLFFFLNFLGALAFLAWFLTSRKDNSRRPTQLRMKGEGQANPAPPVTPSAQHPAPSAATAKVAPTQTPASTQRTEKTLNVLFIYNGHDWDAYEVLGLPAGASLTLVTQRYQELVKTAERGQLEFYEAAHQAILRKS